MSGLTVLVVGATGSIGRHVVVEALASGHTVRALVRSRERGAVLPAAAELVVGDVTRPQTLGAAVEGVEAIVFTLGSDGRAPPGRRRSTTRASAMCSPLSADVASGSP